MQCAEVRCFGAFAAVDATMVVVGRPCQRVNYAARAAGATDAPVYARYSQRCVRASHRRAQARARGRETPPGQPRHEVQAIQVMLEKCTHRLHSTAKSPLGSCPTDLRRPALAARRAPAGYSGRPAPAATVLSRSGRAAAVAASTAA